MILKNETDYLDYNNFSEKRKLLLLQRQTAVTKDFALAWFSSQNHWHLFVSNLLRSGPECIKGKQSNRA